ncbi:MucB/RseB C-terminal domain-containing protein [Marinomonas sp. 15G1-11]|uniref:MucB/RseB C-terminal domain-containing protein n=1 Tax=Marinomonas phaeophyticola TaxID=3004091 RepID=A0ABT4JSM3_9GAMM|nr:MucB/RseB C-terminal domain-containing protein [Marinomonas sp. 15G1-11]MCZ2720828.1 MucB/RseB C-terminal domain-containing protein [Marinomonas sp. 15G1-11]
MKKIIFSLFIGLACSVANASSDDEIGLARLSSMVQSFSILSYQGVFVRSQGEDMNSMKIRHGIIGESEYESLIDLDGDKIEVIRVDNSVICVYPDISFANTATPVSAPLRQFKELNGERLLEGYSFKLSKKKELIAGREAEKLSLIPKDAYRFGHEFWLDAENNFLLKHDTLGAQGKVLDRVQFTDISFSPALKKSDFVPRLGTYSRHLVEVKPKMTDNKWHFEWLPDGFAPVWRDARILNERTAMLLLSDGITSISVFVEPTTEVKPYSVMEMGSTTVGEVSRSLQTDILRLTIVGEVPEQTVEKMLMSFAPRTTL